MKKKTLRFILLISIITGVIFFLNIEVSTRQGINYKVSTLKIPLYLKLLDFYDRHYNYKWCVSRIVNEKQPDEEKVMALFSWVCVNFVRQPAGLKTVDDHVWHIIVRGYGTHDQYSDVFTTLCNYAGMDAFFARVFTHNGKSQIPFSFVRVKNRWHIFDPYNGAYFINKKGALATIEEIKTGGWIEKNMETSKEAQIPYSQYLSNLSLDMEKSHRFSRANIQSPLNRLLYALFRKKF